MKSTAKRVGLETLGWVLLLAGIAGIFLPGPGLLLIFSGLAVLSQSYEWARRWLDPVKYRALKGAAESVETPLRIALTAFGCLWLFAVGVLWMYDPAQPEWWELPDWLWLPGGFFAGVTLVISGFIAVGLMIYSYRRFHGRPDAVAELERDIEHADEVHHRR